MNKEEKEAIEKIKEELIEPFYYFPNPKSIFLEDTQVELLEKVLNYIDKLQKENESLNKKNKRYEKYLKNKDIEHEKVLEYIETEKEHDYISKDKVRTKIKELEEYITGKRSAYRHLSIGEAIAVLHILKELLGGDIE